MARAVRGRFEPSDHFVLGHLSTLELLSALGSPVAGTRFKTLIYLKGFGVGACGGHGFNKQIFGADEQDPKGGCGRCRVNQAAGVFSHGRD